MSYADISVGNGEESRVPCCNRVARLDTSVHGGGFDVYVECTGMQNAIVTPTLAVNRRDNPVVINYNRTVALTPR